MKSNTYKSLILAQRKSYWLELDMQVESF